MRTLQLILLNLIITTGTFAQGYEIPIKVNNLSDSMIYFGHHFGNGYFINDSLKLNKNGETTFKGETKLKGGIYFLMLPKGKYFDFLIDQDQNFSIECDTNNFLNTVKFKNSHQNFKFYAYQQYLSKQYKYISAKKEEQKSMLTNIDTLMLIENEIQLVYNKIYLRKEEIISEHPDSLISVLIKAALPIIPPPAPRDTSGNIIDSLFEYRFVKAHYFDNISFSDERLLRTVVLQNKVLEYLSRMTINQQDSLIHDVDIIIDKASANEHVYKFILNTLFQYYNKSNMISDENIFVHIAEKYFLGNKAPWISEEFIEKLKLDLAKRKPNLIGAKAPDFEMQDNKGKVINLDNIQNRHVIIYFYDVECDLCNLVTPELMNFYRIIKDRGVEIVGVYVGEDKAKWKKYIEDKYLKWINVWDPKNKSAYRENYNIAGTPLIYLLDEDQKIIAKRITIEQLMGYFNSI